MIIIKILIIDMTFFSISDISSPKVHAISAYVLSSVLNDLTSAASHIDEIGQQTLAVLGGKYGMQILFHFFSHPFLRISK